MFRNKKKGDVLPDAANKNIAQIKEKVLRIIRDELVSPDVVFTLSILQ